MPSAFLSSVIPHSVATLVGKKKIADGFADENCSPKKNSRLKYTNGFIPSVSVKYKKTITVGQVVDDCEICTKLL
jgi:hypothetical protein